MACLENFRRNLGRPHSLSLLGTLLSEEDRQPQLIARFRDRLVAPRRATLASAIQAGVAAWFERVQATPPAPAAPSAPAA